MHLQEIKAEYFLGKYERRHEKMYREQQNAFILENFSESTCAPHNCALE